MTDKENKSAREMFEELGYKVEIDNKEILKYKRYGNKYGEDDIEIYNVVFDKFSRCFYALVDGYMSVINIPEYKAIQKQIEELGWE